MFVFQLKRNTFVPLKLDFPTKEIALKEKNMKVLKNYSKALLLLMNIPFAFTNATKQRLRKKVRLLINEG